eukprot:TRINITY_DN3695_c0_g2_i2.p1 TRINITY_DN3695_c0_g2~~TRINITY_DN3695_c0_g2_i2.p1  ORF type:complete len:595 (-),score=117.63 TRINITY_DN3695_c0_g2_i2:95-1846(-)
MPKPVHPPSGSWSPKPTERASETSGPLAGSSPNWQEEEKLLPVAFEACIRRHRIELHTLLLQAGVRLNHQGLVNGNSYDVESEVDEEDKANGEASGKTAQGHGEDEDGGNMPFYHTKSLTEMPSKWEMSDSYISKHLRAKDVVKPGGNENAEPSTRLEMFQHRLLTLIHNPRFDVFFAVLILVNSALVGAEVQYCALERTEIPPPFFLVCAYLLNFAFLIELCFRIVGYGKNFFHVFDWHWNVFDLLAVSTSLLEMLVLTTLEVSGALLILARVIRVVRIVRILRVIRLLRQLRSMTLTVLQTIPSLCWSVVLMMIITFMFAIVFTEACSEARRKAAAGGAPESEEMLTLVNHFGTMESSTFTLLKCITGGENWGFPASSLATHCGTIYLWVFMTYEFFMVFALLNVITGFFCSDAIDMAHDDKDQLIQEQLRDRDKYVAFFKDIFDAMDADGNGVITLSELDEFLFDERLQAYFQHLQINVLQAWTIFRLLDTDGSGQVSLDEFVTGLLRIRGPAKVIDVRSIHHDIKRDQKVLTAFMDFTEQRLDQVESRILKKFDRTFGTRSSTHHKLEMDIGECDLMPQ